MAEVSDGLWIRATRVLAGGPATYSKHKCRYPANAPTVFVRGEGCRVWDADGRNYLDTVAALGPVLLGYRHPTVDAAVHAQVDHGASFSLLHPLEVEVAELLCGLIPCAEMVRFGRNGADVTNAAVRLARYATGREHVFFCGYHGQMDSYISTTANRAGVLDAIGGFNHQLPWGDIPYWEAMLDRYHGHMAAFMVEVPPAPFGADTSAVFLRWLREAASAHGLVFILDEVVSGGRYHLGGAQAYYDIIPDLACFSKALGNGYAVAALVGQRPLMEAFDGEVFCSATFAGETIGLAAAKAVLLTLRDTDALTCLVTQGQRFGDSLLSFMERDRLPATLWGNHARLAVHWQDQPGLATAAELKTLWNAAHAERGILYGPGVVLPMCVYTDTDVQTLLQAADEVSSLMAEALTRDRIRELLPGPPPEEVFASRYVTRREMHFAV